MHLLGSLLYLLLIFLTGSHLKIILHEKIQRKTKGHIIDLANIQRKTNIIDLANIQTKTNEFIDEYISRIPQMNPCCITSIIEYDPV